jgi:hypothetical protein
MKQFNKERGNVLFLILIAVALFAALSYAVTQSSRSGGDAGRETTLINSAVLTQFPAAVRTSVLRLVIEGVAVDRQLFDAPSGIAGGDERISVFHPDGGGSIYQFAPGDIMTDGTPGVWRFNMNFEVPDLGASGASGVRNNELIAFLPNVTEAVCQKVNDEAEITGIPVFGSDISGSYNDDQIEGFDMSTVDDTALTGFAGKAFGCFENSDGVQVFYNVLYEQ